MTEQQTLAEVLARANRPHLSNDAAIRAEAESWCWAETAALAWFDALLSSEGVQAEVSEALYCARQARTVRDTVPEWVDADIALTAVRALVSEGENPPQAATTAARSDEPAGDGVLGRSDVREAREGL